MRSFHAISLLGAVLLSSLAAGAWASSRGPLVARPVAFETEFLSGVPGPLPRGPLVAQPVAFQTELLGGISAVQGRGPLVAQPVVFQTELLGGVSNVASRGPLVAQPVAFQTELLGGISNVASRGPLVAQPVAFQTELLAGVAALTGRGPLVAQPIAFQTELLSGIAAVSRGPLVARAVGFRTDLLVPASPPNLHVVSSQETSLVIAWDPAAAGTASVSAYRVMQNGVQVFQVAANVTQVELTGLQAATGYLLEVVALDEDGGLSDPAELTGWTLLPHPSPVTLIPSHQALDVSWPAAQPAAGVASYRIYTSTSPFASISAMTPVATVIAPATSATLTGLTNDVAHYVAVTTVNRSGGERLDVEPVVATPFDDLAPPPPGAVIVTSSEAESVGLLWTASSNPEGDLAGYAVYVGGTLTETVGPADLEFVLSGLAPSMAYAIGVTAFDVEGNESLPATVIAYTWLDNPAGVAAQPLDNGLSIAFQAVVPTAHVQSYRVYLQPAPFASTVGLTPSLTITQTTATLSGLVNGNSYWLAVTAVNKSGGERTNVAAIEAIPEDSWPPTPPSGLSITSVGATSLGLGFVASGNAAGDRIGHRVRVGGALVATLPMPQVTLLLDGLAPASAHTIAVTSLDDDGNESTPVTIIGYTWMDHPIVTAVTPHDARLDLVWTPATPNAVLSHYALYVAAAPFDSLVGRTPWGTRPAGSTTGSITGLPNGVTSYVAVAAVNKSGASSPSIQSHAGTPFDDAPPGAPGQFQVVSSGATSLGVGWAAPANPSGDLSHYVLRNGGTWVADVPHPTTTYTFQGLLPAQSYALTVVAVDSAGNASAVAATTGYTLLPQPSDVIVSDILHQKLVLAWSAVEPASHVQSYRVYASTVPYSDVTGMAPKVIVPAGTTTAAVESLINGTTYYLAVTTVNKSNGEAKAVTPIQGMPVADAVGPSISGITYNNVALPPGGVVAADGTFRVTASDVSGVATVRFSVNGVLIGLDSSPSGGWSAGFSPEAAGDGPKLLTLEAMDVHGNATSLDHPFTVALAAPAAPSITAPSNNAALNTSQVLVQGMGKAGTTAQVYVNGSPYPGTAQVDGAGKFSLLVLLVPGTNVLEATLSNSGGESVRSSVVSVIYDNTQLAQPKGLSASAFEAGVVKLGWFAVADTSLSGLKGYRVFRSATPFASEPEATLLTPGAVSKNTGYQDLPPMDGVWYYAVSAENNAGTRSELSPIASVASDATLPRATNVAFAPGGAYDVVLGRVGVGPLGVEVTFDEPLLTDPFFSLAISGAQPIPVGLGPKAGSLGLVYSGTVHVTSSSPSGLATAVVSARDLAGNRGTEILGPKTILLDTDAPSVAQLIVTPGAPIQNDEQAPVVVHVEAHLDEPLPSGFVPELSYALSSSQATPTPLALTQLGPMEWAVDLTLPGSAGLVAESLAFSYLGIDDLGNVSTTIAGKTSFEVYQGELPPLVAPLALTAVAQPAGHIALDWANVAGAAEYQVYRRSVGAPAYSPLARSASSAWVDATPTDGVYQYAVSSIRMANGQESESPLSSPAQATSDSVAPNSPQSLDISLAANGIVLEWLPPAPFTEPVTYRIYRAGGLQITSIAGLEPLVTGLTTLLVVDPTPSQTEHAYVVAAEDAVGNVSLPSNSAYLNPGLLPVSSLQVTHHRATSSAPVVSWTHPSSNLAGYVVSVGGVDATPVSPATAYTDAAYGGGARTYGVRAVDPQAQESLERTIRLVPLTVAPAPGATLVRGQIASVDFDVSSPEPVTGATLRVRLNDKDHVSAPFEVDAGTTVRIPVVVGGYASLPASPVTTMTTRREPAAGERIDLIDSIPLPIQSDSYVVQVFDLDLERGAIGTARFSFTNTGLVPVELVTAKNYGNSHSDQIRFTLLDDDGNVLSTSAVKQATDGILALPNGTSVARVMPGETFTSLPMSLPVPSSAPDQVKVRLTIDQVHYDLGKSTHVAIEGLSSTVTGSLVEPPYTATVTSATPALSWGADPIQISGAALITGTGGPAAFVPVVLVVRVDGFERTYNVYTDADGMFAYTFVPGPTEGGVYDVWAKYPGLLSQTVQRTFTIQKLNWNPKSPSITLPAGYGISLDIGVGTGKGTPVTNLRLQSGVLPTGLSVTPAPGKNLSGNATSTVSATILATPEAPSAGSVMLTLLSDERVWGTIPLAYVRTIPAAFVVSTPNYIETGAIRGALETEEVILANKGLASAQGVTATLLNAAKTAPAPSWATVASGAAIGTLAPGAAAPVTLAFAPTSSTVLSATTPYSFVLRVASPEQTLLDVPIYAWVSESGQGGALFHVVDMYTGTVNAQGQLQQGLAGAKVKLDRLIGAPFSASATTDANGEVLFSNLPAGSYRWRVSANGHEATEGNVSIKPGVTNSEEVFLPIPYITIEWDVTEVTLDDKYEILLQATFETDVPAPVVVVEPPSISLPPMSAGDVFLGELKVSNYGLIATQATSFKLPDGGKSYKFELLANVPDQLAAKSSVTLPYRVVKLDGSATSGDSSGGGCGVSAFWGGVSYGWYCLAGTWVWGAFPVVYLVTDTSTCPPGSPPSLSVPSPSSSPVGSGCGGSCGWTTPSWKSQPSEDKPCDPCDHPSLTPLEKECCKTGKKQPTKSEVDLVTGDYSDDLEDLPIQILGWRVPFRRSYHQGVWSFELMDTALEFTMLEGKVDSIRTKYTLFSAANEDGTVFTAGEELQLFAIDDGAAKWRLETRSKNNFFFDAQGKLLEIHNRAGQTLSVDWSAQGRMAALRDTFGEVFATYSYDIAGNIAAIECTLDGRRVEYTWTNGRLTEVRDPEGRLTSYAYDSAGHIVEKRLPNGQVNKIAYTASGMVTSVLDEAGNGTYFDYGFNQTTQQFYSAAIFTDGRLVERWFNQQGTLLETLVDGAEQGALTSGAVTAFDSQGNVTGVKAPDGTTLESNLYDSAGRLIREVDGRGVITDYAYDSTGNLLIETSRRSLIGPVLAGRSYTYDALGRKDSETVMGLGAAPDQTTLYEYDSYGNVIRESYSNGTEVLRTYDHRGALTSETDGLGNAELWQYDALGRLVERRITSGIDGTTIVENWLFEPELDGAGKVTGTRVTYTDPDGREMVEKWDTNDRPYEVVDPWGRVTRLAYDSQGDLVKTISAEGEETELLREVLASGLRRTTRKVDGVVVLVEERDRFDRLIRREVEGEEAHYFYDGDKPLPREIVQPGGRILYEYDYFGNTVEERVILDDGTEAVETRTFDGLRETSHTNALGHTRASAFTESGMPASTALPSGRTLGTEYDPTGRPLEYSSISGDSSLSVEYGAGYQIARRNLPNGAWLDYEYDAAGGVAAIESSWGRRVEADSDRRGNPVEKRWYAQAGDEEPAEIATYEYDSTGLRTLSSNSVVTIETTRDHLARATSTTYDFGPFTKTFTQLHDSSGRTSGIVMPDGTAYGYEYDPFGRIAAVVFPDGSSVDMAYPGSRTQERHYPNGVVWTQTNDAVFNPVSVEAIRSDGQTLMSWEYTLDAHRVSSIATESGSYSFEYDVDEQLIGAAYPTLSADAFTYDLDGNRVSSAETGATPWVYSATDELVSRGGAASYTWNEAGALAARAMGTEVHTFEYDLADRLHRVSNESGQVIAEYEYDADGFRVVKKVGGATTYAIYGEQGLLAEYDAVGNELRRYVWLPGEEWQRSLVAFETGEQRYYPLLDARGEVRRLTDAAGQVTWEAEIRAFGEAVVSPTVTLAFSLRPSGQYFDAETGLHYNTARYYDPALGRYISLDPLLELGGDRNLYGFAFNNPIAYEDRLGLAVGNGKASWECSSNFTALDFKDAGCSGEIKFKVNPWVSLKVSLSIKNNREDCCKDGKLIKKGKGCIEVKISGAAEVGFDPLSYIPDQFHKYLVPAGAKEPFKIQLVKATISGSCNFCNKCGESGYGGSDITCCLDLEVEGPSFSASLGWFKVSVKIGKVKVGKICYGPYGWDFKGPSLDGPSWGGGPSKKK